MVESLVWNKESILNIDKDNMHASTGTATVNGKSLVLGAKSSATYSYTFDTTDNTLETSDLQFILNVINSNTTVSSRYDESVQVETYIKYYKKQVDSSGNITGYIIGDTDTYQINPYFKHESEGYTDTYEVSVENNYIVEIKTMFINNSDNTVTFVNPRVFNSMSVMDAIDEYGGGSGGDEPAPPVINDLTLFSTTGEYTINTLNDSLTLQVVVPDKYIKKDDGPIYISWSITQASGDVSPRYRTSYKDLYKTVNGVKKAINYGQCVITALGDDVLTVRAMSETDSTVYDERKITIRNNNITDMSLKVNSDSGKIDTMKLVNAEIAVLPIRTLDGYVYHNDMELKIDNYEGYALLDNGDTSNRYVLAGGKINFGLYGKRNGKIKITATIINRVNEKYAVIFPTGFKKEFIVDIVNAKDKILYSETPDGLILDSSKEYIDIVIKWIGIYNLHTEDSYAGIESLDGSGNAYVQEVTQGDGRSITYRVFGTSLGKIRFWAEMNTAYLYYDVPNKIYVGRIEHDIDITGLYKELDMEITTNTGLFEITEGGGQLEVHCKPNYNYYGDISFSQVSIDGGSVSIEDKGNNALITANKDGRLNLICTPTKGPSKQVEINISGQYPKDVKLTCADNIFKVPINGSLMIYAEPGNKPNSDYNKYSWATEKLDADVDFSIDTENTNCKCTGKALGKFRLNVLRYIDGKFMTSQVIKVVQSLDSDKTVLALPNEAKYWVVYRRADQGNRLWLHTIDGTVTLNKLIKKTDNGLYTDNININKYAQWKIESGQWANYNSWTNENTHMASNVSIIYASNIDIYNEDGNLLVAKTDNYDDVDFDKIIYG